MGAAAGDRKKRKPTRNVLCAGKNKSTFSFLFLSTNRHTPTHHSALSFFLVALAYLHKDLFAGSIGKPTSAANDRHRTSRCISLPCPRSTTHKHNHRFRSVVCRWTRNGGDIVEWRFLSLLPPGLFGVLPGPRKHFQKVRGRAQRKHTYRGRTCSPAAAAARQCMAGFDISAGGFATLGQ